MPGGQVVAARVAGQFAGVGIKGGCRIDKKTRHLIGTFAMWEEAAAR